MRALKLVPNINTDKINESRLKEAKELLESFQDDTYGDLMSITKGEFSPNGDLVFHVVVYNEDPVLDECDHDSREFKIIFNPLENHKQIGVHLFEVNQYSLADGMETLLKDNYPAIYVHSLQEID